MMMASIVVTAPVGPHQESRPDPTRNIFGFGRWKKSKESTPPQPSPPPAAPTPKRKNAVSPVMLKRKHLRKVRLVPLLQLTTNKSNDQLQQHETPATSPSIFEEELADQENQSPNDPAFLRRAAQRWHRKTGVTQPPLALLPMVTVTPSDPVWSTSPSHQSSFRRRVSPVPNTYLQQSPFLSTPTSPVLGGAFPRRSTQYSSLSPSHRHVSPDPSFLRGSHSYSSLGLLRRRRDTPPSPQRSPRAMRSASSGVSLPRSPSTSTSYGGRGGLAWGGARCGALDDTVAAAVRRQQLREQAGEGLAAPLRRLSVKIRRSLRRSSRPSSPKPTTSLKTSASCHSDLLRLAEETRNGAPSSPTLRPHNTGTTTSPPTLTFNDIFLEEPKLAQKFAIMFPSEARPEWHRHLRQVLNKAGQRIFKKPDPHDTTIPENLRHQLKHIYVY